MRDDDDTDRPAGATVVAVWIALQRVGVPVNAWVHRRVWDNAIRSACDVESTMALRYRTKTARDFGILELDPGHRGKPGRVKLLPLGQPGQFIPLDADLMELAPIAYEQGQEGEPRQPTTT